MATCYLLYGIGVRSAIALPGLHAVRRDRPDVALDRGSSAQFAAARRKIGRGGAESWFTHHQFADGGRYLRWSGLSEFLITPDGRRILFHRLSGATAESVSVYLLGQVLSFSLLAFGIDPLHGTVVVADGQAVGFLGDCGHGKSTLAATLLSRGLPVLTDDLIAAQRRSGRWIVHAGVPRLKLFPSVARRLLGPDVQGTAMNRGTSKLIIPLNAAQSATGAFPLKALYVLSDPGDARRQGTMRPRIEPLSRKEAFLEVIRAAFNLIVIDKRRLTTQFALADQLSSSVPIGRLVYPRTFAALPEACDAVLADLQRLERSDHSGAGAAHLSEKQVARQTG